MPRDWKGIAPSVRSPVYTQLYSPVVVAGSNIHIKTLTMKTKSTKKQVARQAAAHSFKACREAFLTPGPRPLPGTSALVATTDASGNGSFGTLVCPVGLSTAVLSGSTFVAGSTRGNVLGPPLRGLYNRAVQFQQYRITRARFVFVSSLGSNALGIITLAAYTDPLDIAVSTAANYLSSTGTKTFDLGSGANKELSVPVPVDSSWKKVASDLCVVANAFPLTASAATGLAVANTLADLSVCSVTATWQGCSSGGAPASGLSIGGFYLDYDVEFKNPVDAAVNI